MNTETGQLRHMDKLTDDQKEKFTELTDEQHEDVRDMNREKRREWAKKNKVGMPHKEPTNTEIMEKLETIERKIDHIFGGAVLVNGQWSMDKAVKCEKHGTECEEGEVDGFYGCRNCMMEDCWGGEFPMKCQVLILGAPVDKDKQ